MGFKKIPKELMGPMLSGLGKTTDYRKNDIECYQCKEHCWDTEPMVYHGDGIDKFKRIQCIKCKVKGRHYVQEKKTEWI